MACAMLASACIGLPLAAGSTTTEDHGLFGKTYPLDVTVSFHKALLHWVDSLAMLSGHGATGGKTIPAHRLEFERVLGSPTPKDVSMLKRFHSVRMGDINRAPAEERDRITLAFFEASSLDDALDRCGEILEPNPAKAFADAMRHFASRYERIWNDGEIANGFVSSARSSERRNELAEFLTGVARFFDVKPDEDPRPQIVLAPVPPGSGTHAQAIRSYLLIEIRRGEELGDEAAPIIHENAHFLYRKIPPTRREQLQRTALEAHGEEAWYLLKEALPTAIAQGVADRSFRQDSWSRERPWYHDPAVDDYAKRIFPLIEDALENGGTLDETFVKKLVAAYGAPAATAVTPRSP